ncbi:MAG: energy transducer TonB [Crocinitomicaceae bacterium]|nr:energy transducer TonB [Crocinitomicaceae bacterium]MBK8928037.1 energy transducer TonB [Crocinitomicaceae bacterium]
MRFLIVLCLSFYSLTQAVAQDPIPIFEDDSLIYLGDVEASFPGGDLALEKFVSDHIVYPDSAIYYGAEGTVYVRFVVNKDGTLSDIVVMKSAGKFIGAEAIRVFSIMPKWEPATHNGYPVTCRLTYPLKFSLNQ